MTKKLLAACNSEFVARLAWLVSDQFDRQLEGESIDDTPMSRGFIDRLNIPVEMLGHAAAECELTPPPSVVLNHRYNFTTTADAKRLANAVSEWGTKLVDDISDLLHGDDGGSLIPDLKGRTPETIQAIRETVMSDRS